MNGLGHIVSGWTDETRAAELKSLVVSAVAAAIAVANTQPTGITTPAPIYPEIAHEMSLTGRMLLHVLVGADGLVKNVKVIRSWGPAFDERAIAAVKSWTFNPALAGGVPVASWVRLPVDFQAPLPGLPHQR